MDEGLEQEFYRDADSDGYGLSSDWVTDCAVPSGYAALDGDCDDDEPAANPGATEVCDGLDNNCVGGVDEGVLVTFYQDGDSDGYGTTDATVEACIPPSGFADNDADCDDANRDINPSATEVCDEADNDCDGSIDEFVTSTYYTDADGDGFGDAALPQEVCTLGPGLVSDDTDCDDSDAAVNPGATEVCNGLDDDCDSTTSEAGTASFEDAAGTISALSVSTTSGSTTALTLAQDGTATFCSGTFYVNLEVSADVVVQGIDSSLTTLDGGESGSVVSISTSGASVAVAEVTVTGGDASLGGGLLCEGANTLEVTDAVIAANRATYGGGVAVDGCTTVFDTVTVTANDAVVGGGLDFGNASGAFTDVTVSGNTASSIGGGLHLSNDGAATELSFLGGSIDNNSAAYGGGGELDGATHAVTLTLEGTEVTSNSSSNASYSGAFFVGGDGLLLVRDSNWGSATSGDDNAADDVTTYSAASGFQDYDGYDAESWFRCDEDGCGAYLYSGATGTLTYEYAAQATTPGTRNCDLTFLMLGTGTQDVCSDCAFGFDFELYYSSSLSTNDGTCGTNDVSWSLGFVPDPTNYTFPVVYYDNGTSWVPAFGAAFDGTTLRMASGYADQLTYGYYNTDYFYATAYPY